MLRSSSTPCCARAMPRGSFADMADEDARRAIEALSEQEFEGRRLLIREAEDRPRRERHA